MGIVESLGLSNLFGGFNWAGLGVWATIIIISVGILIISGIVALFYYGKKVKSAQFIYKIPIFMKINEKQTRIGMDEAKEVFIPDSNISLFFLKAKKIYIARPTRAMAKNEFWYSISENGEWVNFDLSVDPERDTLSLANYDHRDTRYAYVNLKDLIKRNYKDKALQWWKDPVIMNIIAFIIMTFIFGAFCWLMISKMGNMISQLSPLVELMNQVSENMVTSSNNLRNINSGIVSA